VHIQHSTSSSDICVGLQFAVYGFQICWREISLPRHCTGLFSHDGGVGTGSMIACMHACMVIDAHLYVLQFYAGNFGASVGEK
jgi:hypothetical protein